MKWGVVTLQWTSIPSRGEGGERGGRGGRRGGKREGERGRGKEGGGKREGGSSNTPSCFMLHRNWDKLQLCREKIPSCGKIS